MRQLKSLFLVLGIGFLLYAIHATGGLAPMFSALIQLRGWFLLAFAATFVAQCLRTTTWSVIIENYSEKVSFLTLYRIRSIGEALNYLTFAGPFLGDPTKAVMLSKETGFSKSGMSVAVDRYLYTVASVLFMALAACGWFGGWGVTALIVTLGGILVSTRFLGKYSKVLSRSKTYTVLAIHTAANIFMALEAMILMKGLGVNGGLMEAISAEAINKGMNAIFFFVPMQMGVAEGGSAMLFHFLSTGVAAGLALGVGRRVRSLIWSVLGLAMLLQSKRTVTKGGQNAVRIHPSVQFSK